MLLILGQILPIPQEVAFPNPSCPGATSRQNLRQQNGYNILLIPLMSCRCLSPTDLAELKLVWANVNRETCHPHIGETSSTRPHMPVGGHAYLLPPLLRVVCGVVRQLCLKLLLHYKHENLQDIRVGIAGIYPSASPVLATPGFFLVNNNCYLLPAASLHSPPRRPARVFQCTHQQRKIS